MKRLFFLIVLLTAVTFTAVFGQTLTKDGGKTYQNAKYLAKKKPTSSTVIPVWNSGKNEWESVTADSLVIKKYPNRVSGTIPTSGNAEALRNKIVEHTDSTIYLIDLQGNSFKIGSTKVNTAIKDLVYSTSQPSDTSVIWGNTNLSTTGKSVFYEFSNGKWKPLKGYLSLNDYGAIADRKSLNVTTTNGSSTIVVSGYTLTSKDVGKHIVVQNAELSNNNSSKLLMKKIISITNSTTAIIESNANVSVSNARSWIGTDCKPAFDLAFDSIRRANGGKLRLEQGDYLYIHTMPFFGTAYNYTVTKEASNFIFEGDGKPSIMFCGIVGLKTGFSRPDITRYCTNTTNPATYVPPAWGLATYKRFEPAIIGSYDITLHTISDISNYAKGDTVFLQSGNMGATYGYPPRHYEWNVIDSVNVGLGKIVLNQPLTDSYDNVDTIAYPIVAKIGTIPHNIVFQNLKLEMATTEKLPVVVAEGGIDVTFDRCNIYGMSWNGFSKNTRFQNSNIEGSPYNESNLGDFGDCNIQLVFDNNVIKNFQKEVFYGALTGREYIIKNNVFSDYNLSKSSIVTCVSVEGNKSTITNNTIFLPKTDFSVGIRAKGRNFDISDNKIFGTGKDENTLGISVTEGSYDYIVKGNNIKIDGGGTGFQAHANNAIPDSINNGYIVNNLIDVPNTGISFHNAVSGWAKDNVIGYNILKASNLWTLGTTNTQLVGWIKSNLSNLQPTAINENLVANTDVSKDLGSVSLAWRKAYASNFIGKNSSVANISFAPNSNDPTTGMYSTGSQFINWGTVGQESMRWYLGGTAGTGIDISRDGRINWGANLGNNDVWLSRSTEGQLQVNTTIGNPLKLSHLQVGANTDSSIVSASGVLKRIATSSLTKKVFTDSCAVGTTTLRSLATNSGETITVSYGKTITYPFVQLTLISDTAGPQTLSVATQNSTQFQYNFYNATTATVIYQVNYRVCPNFGQGY